MVAEQLLMSPKVVVLTPRQEKNMQKTEIFSEKETIMVRSFRHIYVRDFARIPSTSELVYWERQTIGL